MKNLTKIILSAAVLIAAPLAAFAHEAYVLPQDFFWSTLNGPVSAYALSALSNPDNLRVFLEIAAAVIVVYGLNFLLRLTSFGRWLHRAPERFSSIGPFLVRLTISASFFFSAASWSFLGPELHMTDMPWPWLMRTVMFIVAGMIALGVFTEIAALIALAMFTIGFFVYGSYLATYLNYLGELIVLVLFGMRWFSVDRVMFGPLRRFPKFREYETTIVRVCYGLALSFAAITVKFLHPALTMQVVTQWHLTQFHWLFPSDPLLVTLGGGLAELAIGLFIIFGFEMRLTVLISLFYITLSLLYFRELVWPHLMLYGISLSLLVKPEVFTLDHFFFDRDKAAGKAHVAWWKRPWMAHKERV